MQKNTQHANLNLNQNLNQQLTVRTARVCRPISLCTTVVHNTAQVMKIFPLILQTIVIAQMLSTGGEGVQSHDTLSQATSNRRTR